MFLQIHTVCGQPIWDFNDLFLNYDIYSPQSLTCGFILTTEHKFLTLVAKFKSFGRSKTHLESCGAERLFALCLSFTACTPLSERHFHKEALFNSLTVRDSMRRDTMPCPHPAPLKAGFKISSCGLNPV